MLFVSMLPNPIIDNLQSRHCLLICMFFLLFLAGPSFSGPSCTKIRPSHQAVLQHSSFIHLISSVTLGRLPALLLHPLDHLLDLVLGLYAELPLGLHGRLVAQDTGALHQGVVCLLQRVSVMRCKVKYVLKKVTQNY